MESFGVFANSSYIPLDSISEENSNYDSSSDSSTENINISSNELNVINNFDELNAYVLTLIYWLLLIILISIIIFIRFKF